MLKGAVFDLDGTLVDTVDDLMSAMNSMLRSFGYPERRRDEIIRFIGNGARTFVCRSLPDGLFEEDSDEVTKALRVYSDFYSTCYAEKSRPFENMKEELQRLKNAGVRLGVLSNKQEKFVREIIYKMFGEMFDAVHGHLDMPEKPDPTAALAVASEIGAAPSECAFVGDSDVDMMTGVNAGMIPVGVTWGYRSKECLIESGAFRTVDSARELSSLILGSPVSNLF